MSYVIEKNVPISSSHGSQAIYPFKDMEVGDSFLVPASKDKGDQYNTQRRCASMYGVRNNKKFTSRKVEGGLRIWRTA